MYLWLRRLISVIKNIIAITLPELSINVYEGVSEGGKRYVATLSNSCNTMLVYADTDSDWLPDEFFEQLQSIPAIFKSDKRFYSINPAIGLTGQDAWYFCSTEANLKQARIEGLPIVFPGEDITETEEFKRFMAEE